ncbi:FKBP-type peptidyl-prolyl cis-trans isomerase [Leucobacter insecticola]|uniref:peptidylprolyl isomerase n=1 Tax=Leucobacter insecticola TaxID=2714934 RepID=A0A6G8FLZ8_9MICO|nr:FKBP-type peptidyl-prolyl cis-trans isomerase [Leucobacter insecticola]QIM17112.1 FKBP-type peptidyl-prolyl cis-trans isomerase [Leucobacter insecticola]
MKRSHALVPIALTATLLMTACSAGGNSDASGEACLASGSVSNSIKVEGKVGEEMELTTKTPISTDKAQRTVLTEGKGDMPKEGESIETSFAIFSGVDGTLMQQSPATPVDLVKDQMPSWAYDAVRCAIPDQRVALVAPLKDVTQGQEPSALGLSDITNDDSVVIVMDFGKVGKGTNPAASEAPGTLEPGDLLAKAEGKAKDAPKGFPTVKLAENGEPTITMPKDTDAPKDLEIATLIEGKGETVEPGDRVYVNYRGVIWRTGEEFDSSWSRGAPVPFLTNEVIEGFTKAIEGQKVGSQVISIVPPAAGYGDQTEAKLKASNPDFDVTNDDTLVFVLDIVGVVHANK